ncbi:YoaK family protein [Dyella sp.]|uniref:YoaK family protein n=1 Tax=Dyella sp. TaxID=1869338 RepID=UPI002ED69C80
MKISIPQLLTFNGGYVDTAGFLALQGLFTAHVTGNFVTIGASLIHGSSGVVAKLLALPVFCLVVGLVRYASGRMEPAGTMVVNSLAGIKIFLFIIAAVLALWFGPFSDGDSPAAIVTGLTLVAGMAIQNAIHRVFFPKDPPTTLMTGSTTQIMLDLADLVRANLPPETRLTIRMRCMTLFASVCIFAAGCAAAALIYHYQGALVFVFPPLVAALGFLPYFQSGLPLAGQQSR